MCHGLSFRLGSCTLMLKFIFPKQFGDRRLDWICLVCSRSFKDQKTAAEHLNSEIHKTTVKVSQLNQCDVVTAQTIHVCIMNIMWHSVSHHWSWIMAQQGSKFSCRVCKSKIWFQQPTFFSYTITASKRRLHSTQSHYDLSQDWMISG